MSTRSPAWCAGGLLAVPETKTTCRPSAVVNRTRGAYSVVQVRFPSSSVSQLWRETRPITWPEALLLSARKARVRTTITPQTTARTTATTPRITATRVNHRPNDMSNQASNPDPHDVSGHQSVRDLCTQQQAS